MTTVLTRPYEPSDREPVAALDVATKVHSVADLRLEDDQLTWIESPLLTVKQKDHGLADYLVEDLRCWDEGFVAIDGGRVVGFAASRFSEWNSRLTLCHMYVDGSARRLGVGTALLHAIMNGEGATSAQHVWLETQTDNVPAIRAYERMGFRLVGLDQTLYGDRPGADTAVFMSRPISR